ncbi:hypothetical protein [Amycolatopsis arida]|uniref:hypothetical protein n=1 Tax=Amycolatopsis arida TaxID=587909 RepID=UPI0010649155|nr:hypothetical protein [Amycolatopsis arida]TDX84966.1 hypothetical protein CLV69_11750 [Amycolatopsis arida]
MDPISAMLLAGVMAVLVTRTAASAVTDTIAQAKGKTPPSLEKWRKKQDARARRGEQVEADPGPWRRRWRNAVEYRNAKAAQKHQARMEFLRDHSREIVDRHKRRLEKRAARRDRIGATVAGWGNSSWEAAKHAAEQAREAHLERLAWKENERRSADPDDVPDTAQLDTDPTGDPGREAAVLPFRRPAPTGDGKPHAEADEDEEEARPARPDDADELDRYAKDHPGLAEYASGIAGCADNDADQLDLYYGILRHSKDDPNPTDTEGTSVTTPTHSGEITDLSSAIAYVSASSDYCTQITATFETAHTQATQTADDLQRQLASLELAQSTLAGQGFDESITGRFGSVSEQFTALVANMRQVTELLASTQEAIASAKAELDTAGQVFSSQLGIAEQVQSQQSVATNTQFYANA